MSGHPLAGRARRLLPGDVARLLVTWAVASVALGVSAALLPGLSGSGWWVWVEASLVTGVVGGLLRPLLVLVAAAVGWVALLVAALVGQALVVHVALLLVPGVQAERFLTTLAAAWITATVATVLGWLITAGTPESLVASLVADGARDGPASPVDGLPGVLFVQLDGVPAPLLTWAMQAGLMPTVRRWVDTGSHRLEEWRVQTPCTTPASQLGILHGTCDGVPAFRWFDRRLGRVLVANRAADAKEIEVRASDGRGLLADDGVSVSNLFSGDAERSFMVFSKVEVARGRFETRRALGRFLLRPDGVSRSIARAVAEVGRERFQARRQRRRRVVPRVARPWPFTGLRAGTNALLRDVNLAVVAGAVMAGRRSVYVDFVDYDEVAHHAGPMRLESLQVLAELDVVVAMLAEIAEAAPRDYEIVLLSDHGQSLGAPFRERWGTDLAEVCRGLMRTEVRWAGDAVEDRGRLAGLAHDVAGRGTAAERAAGSIARRIDGHLGEPTSAGPAQPVVLGSGNLGLVYSGEPHRLTLEEVEARWPALVLGLVAHPGVSVVTGLDASGTPVAVGACGRRDLPDGAVTGEDPLAGLPPHAGVHLAAATLQDTAPDLYVNSAVDPSGEVAAFEDLVGSHGGLGGWQDRGLLLAPAHLLAAVPHPPVDGAEALHRLLVGMLEHLGHRTALRDPALRGSGS